MGEKWQYAQNTTEKSSESREKNDAFLLDKRCKNVV